jgi:hypothetical protein
MRLTVIRIITTAIILAALSSCATSEKKAATATPEQILAKAMGEGKLHPGKVSTLPGADRSDLPYVPVSTPPQIARIWIYDHVTPSKDLVVGHWIFVRLKEEKWYIEEQWEDTSPFVKKRAPLPPGPAPSNMIPEPQTPSAPSVQKSQLPPSTQPEKFPPQASTPSYGVTPVPPAGR